jgi:hypothetical protein
MIIYDFIEQRFDQLLNNDHTSKDAENMVDSLYDLNFLKFRQADLMVNDICKELYYEIESIYTEDIPF